MKKFFFRKHAEAARKAVAGERKLRESRTLDLMDCMSGTETMEERILACASAQLQMEILDLFWN